MNTTLKRIGIGLGAIAALLLVGIAVIVATFDANRYKGEITRIVKEKKQRTLTIAGDLSLSFWPNVGVKLGKTTLSEHGSETAFASLDSVRVSVAVMPLLSKQLVIDTVDINGASATLVKHKDGTLNIDDLLSKDKEESQTVRFAISGVRVSNAQLGWTDEKSGQTAAITHLNLSTGRIANAAAGKLDLAAHLSANQPNSDADLKVTGNYELNLDQKHFALTKLDASVKGELAGVQGFDLQIAAAALGAQADTKALSAEGLSVSAKGAQGANSFNVRLDVPKIAATSDKVGGEDVSLSVDATQGEASMKGQLRSAFSADLSAQKFELAKFSGEFVIAHPQMLMKSVNLPISGNARADLQKQTADLALNTQFDESRIDAKLSVEKFAPLAFGFAIDVDKLNVDKYLPPVKADGKAGASAPGNGKIDLSAVKSLNLHGTIRVGALQVSNVKATNIRVDLRAGGGRLDIAPLSANLYHGSLAGSASIDANGNGVVIKQTLANIDINPLLVDLAGKDLVDGHGNVAVDVSTRGETVAAMKKALNGAASVKLKDGALKGINLAQTFRDLKGKLSGQPDVVQVAKAADKTDFSELNATFRIANGVAHNDDLAMKSPFIRLSGSGDIDVGNDAMNYLAKASVVNSAGGQGTKDLDQLKGVTVPVRVSGPFDKLSFKLELASLVTDTAKAKVAEKKQEVQQKLQDSAKDKLKGLFGR